MSIRKNLLWTALLTVLTSSPATADIEECLQIATDSERLLCYDVALGRTQIDATSIPSRSDWDVRIETSDMTDETNVYISVASESPVSCGYGRTGTLSLMVRCREDTTAIFISGQCHFTSSQYNDYGDVTYRIDDAQVATVSMNESTDNRALGLWSGRRSIPLIQQLFGKSTMRVRITPFSESPVETSFNITGLEDEIGPLREACHW